MTGFWPKTWLVRSKYSQGSTNRRPPTWTGGWWGASIPNAATYHLTHSDVNQIIVDVLRPSDSPPDSPFVLTKEVPIIILDSLDKFWAAESRTKLPLRGVRVPVEGDSPEAAKAALAADLATQLRLLLLLSSSHRELAPQLRKTWPFCGP